MNQRDERHDDPAHDPHQAPPGQRARRRRGARSKTPQQRVNAADLMHDMLTGEALEGLIRRLRQEHELTLAEVTRQAGAVAGHSLSTSQLSNWEKGRAPLPLEWLPALAITYDTPIEILSVAAVRCQCQHRHHG